MINALIMFWPKITLQGYVFLLIEAIILFVTILLFNKIVKGTFVRNLEIALLCEYISILAACTIIFRPVHYFRQYNLQLFWSYKELLFGNEPILWQIIFNIIMFVPIGILITLLAGPNKKYCSIIIGLLISISIELIQFFSLRGLCELDDVFHNTLGCFIGYGLCKLIKFQR